MRNMFAAIETGSGRYTMAFHEDDLLSAGYIEQAVGSSNAIPGAGSSRASCGNSGRANRCRTRPARSGFGARMFASGADLVRGILRGVNPMFGSVVYRRAALEHARPDLDRFDTLVDRPISSRS